MSHQLDRLEAKLEKLDEKIDNRLQGIQKELNQYNVELKIHIEGVEQNREVVKNLAERVEPVEKHVLQVQGVLAVVKWIGAGGMLAMCAGLAKYFNFI